MKKIIIPLLLILSSCGNGSDTQTVQAEDRKYDIPIPPAMITDQQQRVDYLALHFWDKFDFTDTTDMKRPEFIDQLFADYVNFLQHTEQRKAEESINKLLDRAFQDSVMQIRFIDLFEHYLHDPNSPMRDEDLYIPFLARVVASPYVSDISKQRPAYQLEIALKNRVGSKANDFTYTPASGTKSTLYNTHAEYLILFINNPGCAACREYIQALDTALINSMIERGQLKVLAIYPDEDLGEWRKYQQSMPAHWINSYDATLQIKNDFLYDLKAIPSLYLLGKDKTVLLKDAMPFEVIRYLDSDNK